MLKGRIIKNISNLYVVISNNQKYNCKPRGKFREMGLTPLVGDIVEFDEENNYLLKILPRTNELKRPPISNIDIALIVTSMKKPDLSLFLLDKEIASIKLSLIEPVICFTKIDLLDETEQKELTKLRAYYEAINIKTFTNNDLLPLTKYLKDKYIVLTGQTGAGKSSLINRIDNTKNINIGEYSEALGRGRHTTRHTEFYQIDTFYIADTPGFSALDLTEYTNEQIRDVFPEFSKYTCKYRDCMHLKEEECIVKDELAKGYIMPSRYDSYKNLMR